MIHYLWAVSVLACFALRSVVTVRVYESFDSQNHCFRRMNLTHQIGCASAGDGSNYGLAYAIDASTRDKDLEFITHSGQNAPYTAVISSALLNDFDLFTSLKNADRSRVSGILILEDDNNTLNAYSPDRSCPNVASSAYYNNSTQHSSCKSQEWNKPLADHKEGLMFLDIPFPIFIIRNSTQVQQIRSYLSEHLNEDSWPKLAIELTSRMTAAQNSETCLRKSRFSSRPTSLTPEVFCDPLGGLNIFQHNVEESHLKTQQIVLVGSRQDSFSLFEGIAPGADSALTSMIVLLGTMELLYRSEAVRKDLDNGNKRLMFSLFDGEAWDYIGSGDTVYQMLNNSFPLSDFVKEPRKIGLKDVDLFVELNQLAAYGPSIDLFLHAGDYDTKTASYLKVFEKQSGNIPELAVKVMDKSKPMPPGSVHSFMKKNYRKSNGEWAVSNIMISNHEAEYTNKLYNSFRENITVDSNDFSNKHRLSHIVDLMSQTIYDVITGKKLPANFPKANETLIAEMLNCFLVNSNCRLFRELPGVSVKDENARPPFSTYVSVYGVSNVLRQFTKLLMATFTSTKIDAKNFDDCTSKNHNNSFCYWKNDTNCFCSTAFMLQTVSPAVDPSSYELRSENTKDYALWTESKWQTATVRFFVVSSAWYRATVIIVGLIILALSLLANHLFNRHFCDLFCLKQQDD